MEQDSVLPSFLQHYPRDHPPQPARASLAVRGFARCCIVTLLTLRSALTPIPPQMQQNPLSGSEEAGA